MSVKSTLVGTGRERLWELMSESIHDVEELEAQLTKRQPGASEAEIAALRGDVIRMMLLKAMPRG